MTDAQAQQLADTINSGTLDAVARLRAALAQAAPDHETRAELAEQQVVQLAEERDHYRRLLEKAQQAEPVQDFRLTECVFVGPPPAPHEDWHHAISAMLREKHISGLRISTATADDWYGIKEKA